MRLPVVLEQNHIAEGDKNIFSFGKSENASIFGGTDESVPYGFGCLKDRQTAVYRDVGWGMRRNKRTVRTTKSSSEPSLIIEIGQ